MDDKAISILLIEDNPDDVRLVREMLARAEGARFHLECADRLSTGLSVLAADEIDVVLLDLWLPDSQGLDTLGNVLAEAPQLPVVVLTSMDDTATAVKAVRDGAQDYLVKGQVDSNLLARCIQYAIERRRAEEALRRSDEFSRSILDSMNDAVYTISVSDNKILGCNRVFLEQCGLKEEEAIGKKCYEVTHGRSDPCTPPITCPVRATIDGAEHSVSEHVHYRADDEKIYVEVCASPIRDESGRIIQAVVVSRDVTERRLAEEELEQSFDRLQRMLQGAVNALAAMAEKRDSSTAGHQQGVVHLASAIAEEMGLSEERIEGIQVAGIVHDIGKIYVPAEVLNKSGKLTGIEFAMIRAHPQAGYDILKTVDFPWPVAEIVLQHHERMDGSGYPQGLRGSDILVEARILAVADVIEAMLSHRPYRPAHSTGEAFEEISRNKGTLYDPEAVDACLKVIMERGFHFR
ncbi:MAG: histidine kinase [Chloroflexi bacterium B3_Chlor]|nr:MAG: histidine kinase [Chloroflexi bacterium B3_Chlor]